MISLKNLQDTYKNKLACIIFSQADPIDPRVHFYL